MYSRTRCFINLPNRFCLFGSALEASGKKGQNLDKNEAGRHKERAQVGTRERHRTAPGQFEGKRVVVSQVLSALLRALMVAITVALPALLLPTIAPDMAELVLIVAVLAALLTFIEYYGRYPSIVAFRFAPPFNRLKFAAVALSVVALSLIMRGKTDPNGLTQALTVFADGVGHVLDFPYSPVRLMLLVLPYGSDPAQVADMRMVAGLCYAVSLAMVLVFVIHVRRFNWPMQRGTFNVWVNLPLFDPTSGGDVIERLRRDGGINILLGIVLPFFMPLAVRALLDLSATISVIEPHALIWVMTAWAILPASLLMRGIALLRVASLIAAKRRRVHLGRQEAGEALGGG